MDYKEFARQMRENCVKDNNGIIICSAELWEKIASIIENTAEALEKQIPKKPIPIYSNRTPHNIISYKCPNCGNHSLGNNEYIFACCEDCGQALDWSDT